ncbi:MAG: hypothetical protein ACXV8Q_17625 [Methylobacter sp.]
MTTITTITTTELKRFFELCLIQKITFHRIDRDDEDCPVRWQVWLESYEGMAIGKFKGWLMNSSREEGIKVYTSLDRAYSDMKELGYGGKFEIDG